MLPITFESIVRGNAIEIPKEFSGKITSPVLVTIIDTQYAGRHTPPQIIPRKGVGPINEDSFTPFINTEGWKFDRDEANER